MQIVTARLRIDALVADDAATMHAYRADPAVARFQGWRPASVAEVSRFIAAQEKLGPDEPGTWWQRAIRLRDDGTLIGDLGLHFIAPDTVEIGISLAPAHQHRGHARETLEVAFDFIFGGLGKQRLIALVDPRNAPCLKLLEGLGMQREAHPGGPAAEDVYLSLPAHAWLAPPGAEGG